MPFLTTIEGTYGFGRGPVPTQSNSNIITDGLLIQMDASNALSYPGTGTTWSNVTSASFNGTLTPTAGLYVAAAPTYLTFNGTDQYVNIADAAAIRPSIGGAVTAIIWANVTSYTSAEGLISKQFGAPTYDGFSLVLNTSAPTPNRLQLNMNGQSVNGIYLSGNNAFSTNTWTMFSCVVRFGGGAGNPSLGYVNGTQVISAANSESFIPSNTAPLRLVSGIQEGSPYPACGVGAFYYYNRALSVAEIQTMFTATRTRYGV